MKIIIISVVLMLACLAYTAESRGVYSEACTAAKDLVLCLPPGRRDCDHPKYGVVSLLNHQLQQHYDAMSLIFFIILVSEASGLL